MKRNFAFAVLTSVFVGCGVNPGTTAAPVEVTGRVTLKGKPLSEAILHLQPTENGKQAMLQVTNGEVKGTITPGTYAFYLEGKKPAVTKMIPEKNRAGSMDALVEIAQGATLDIAIN